MRLDRKLNMVVPLVRDNGTTIHVFASPVGQETFETYYMVLSKTFTQIYGQNLTYVGGPRVAALLLRDVARNTLRPDGSGNWWEGADGIENGFMAEMHRRANVLVPVEGQGWQTVMFEDALKQGLIDSQEAAEVDGALTFFTVNLHMHKASQAAAVLEAASGLWGFATTLLALSDYRSSLVASTEVKATATVEASSLPS